MKFSELLEKKKKKPGSPNYYRGLDKKTAGKRAKAIGKRMRDRSKGKAVDFTPLPGDKGAKTKKSKYSKTPEANKVRELMKTGLSFVQAASKASGVKPSIIKQVLSRGRAAWATGGHRPGTTAEQWGKARVYSFISGGKTQKTADSDLWAKHRGKGK